MNEPLVVDYLNIEREDNIARYCINRIFELKNHKVLVSLMLAEGGIGGDLDWGIHKFDEHCVEDYGVSEFKGWRFYLGADESPNNQFVECYLSEESFIELLGRVFPDLSSSILTRKLEKVPPTKTVFSTLPDQVRSALISIGRGPCTETELWLNESIPALGQKSIIEVLNHSEEGLRQVIAYCNSAKSKFW
ncbi:hypothetical protein [Reinekea sp. G2M2-21]|uniref:hypothetical protein n=1 Tax=Reinekea sp. G2M2-21 TaxID=2788942 RepID=UPI0018A8F3F1|nr:hypothetical protein [Reinekea sp. G2M2-21]